MERAESASTMGVDTPSSRKVRCVKLFDSLRARDLPTSKHPKEEREAHLTGRRNCRPCPHSSSNATNFSPRPGRKLEFTFVIHRWDAEWATRDRRLSRRWIESAPCASAANGRRKRRTPRPQPAKPGPRARRSPSTRLLSRTRLSTKRSPSNASKSLQAQAAVPIGAGDARVYSSCDRIVPWTQRYRRPCRDPADPAQTLRIGSDAVRSGVERGRASNSADLLRLRPKGASRLRMPPAGIEPAHAV